MPGSKFNMAWCENRDHQMKQACVITTCLFLTVIFFPINIS